MFLTEEQQAILNGSKGETMAKVMESVVRYGELFGAEKLIPVTSKYNHLVTSFGLKALGPVYDLMNKLITPNSKKVLENLTTNAKNSSNLIDKLKNLSSEALITSKNTEKQINQTIAFSEKEHLAISSNADKMLVLRQNFKI